MVTAPRVLVTGAASGIGAAIVRTFAQAGWQVYGLDRQDRPADSAARAWMVCDLDDDAAVEAAISRLIAENWTALVMCAGVAGVGDIARVLRINFFAARRLVEALAPVVADGAAIVLVSSSAGMKWLSRQAELRTIVEAEPITGLSHTVALCPDAAEAYLLSKQLLSFYGAWRCLAEAGRGVRTNVLSPGGVETPLIPDFTRSMGTGSMDFSLSVTGRHAEPGEIADVALFLASPAARWINGAEIRVDGGLTGALAAGIIRNPAWE